MPRRLFLAALACTLALPSAAQERRPINLNDDGGWCWFQDERALVVAGRLIFGSVAAGRSDPSRRGAVEATSVDLRTGATTRFRLSATSVEKAGRYDDHDTPVLAVRGDGRLVAVWAGHGYDNRILSRVSLRPGDATTWSDERAFVPSPSSSVTYSNLHRLAGERGRMHDFFRGLDNRYKPSVAWSDDEGATWHQPVRVTSGETDKWFPWVAARGGKIGVVYQEESSNGSGMYVVNLATSTNDGASWAYQTVSTAVSDPNHSVWFRANTPSCPQCSRFIGDYIGLAFDTSGRAHLTWTDMRRDISVPQLGRTGKAQDPEYARR